MIVSYCYFNIGDGTGYVYESLLLGVLLIPFVFLTVVILPVLFSLQYSLSVGLD